MLPVSRSIPGQIPGYERINETIWCVILHHMLTFPALLPSHYSVWSVQVWNLTARSPLQL